MNFSINPTTGNQEANFSAKLLSISEKTLVNSNDKNYKIATIEFKDINNETQRTSAFIYEGNYKYGMTIGESYLATASQVSDGVIVRLSHLVSNGNRPNADMFGFEAVATEITAAAESEVF